MLNLKLQKGITLLEIMLVLAIGSSLILLGVRQYQQYRQEQYPEELKLKIDQLFQAAAAFYQANCSKTLSSTITVKELQDQGFLSSRWSPTNPLVDSYVIQFNQNAPTERFIYTCYAGTCEPPQVISADNKNVYTYQIQVAARLVTSSEPLRQSYKALLGADCLSTLNGTQVTPCTSATTGTYLVWTRSPSLAAFQSNSNLWPSLHQVKQFNLQYTHDAMYEMINPNEYGNYQCGG